MARPLRIEYEGAFYHVLARGERRENTFNLDGDKDKFFVKLAETAEKFRLLIHAYVLMDNHYHLLVETPQANLSKAMHHLRFRSWCEALNVPWRPREKRQFVKTLANEMVKR